MMINKFNRWKTGALVAFFCMGAVSCSNYEIDTYDQLLSDDWKVQSSEKIPIGGTELSGESCTYDDWYDASVPSTVMGVLSANGLYADAFTGDNYKKIDAKPFDSSWWYVKEFDINDFSPEQHYMLRFDGVSYRANVWLNGKQIASKNELVGPFRQFEFDITELIARKNKLAVEVFKAQAGDPNIGFVDWNPRPKDESMGIFREVHLHRCKEVSMNRTFVRSKVNTETLDEAWLTLETVVENKTNRPVKGVLCGELEGKIFQHEVTLEPLQEKQLRIDSKMEPLLHLVHPRLWWCHNMGTPEMYRLNLSFKVDDNVSDQHHVDFGVREVKSYLTEEGYRGFELNGKKVLVRSAGWTDDLFLRDNPVSNEMQVQYVRDMNLNSIRFENIWGTSQNIYDLCDRYGLMVLVGWSCQWEWENYLGTPVDEYGGIKTPEQVNLIGESFRDQVLWLRNHPSIIAWFVGSDLLPRPALEQSYRQTLELYDNRSYITSAKAMVSELSGPSGTKMNGPYEYVGPNYWYKAEAPGGAFGFNTETGIGAQLPVKESLEKMLPKDKMWPLSDVWNYHCTASTTAMNSLDELWKQVTIHYGEPTGLDDFLRKADLLNYEGTRAMFEAFRVNIKHTTGIVQWMLNSAWPSLYWQLYDYYGIPTAAYYSVKKANRVQQLVYDYEHRRGVAVNEGALPVTLYARMLLFGLDGKKIDEQVSTLSVGPGCAEPVFDVREIRDNAFLFLVLEDEAGCAYEQNVYCLAEKDDEYDWKGSSWYQSLISQPADFKRLSALHQADCLLEVVDKVEKEDGLFVTFQLKNQSEVIALLHRLALKDSTGNLVKPVFWSDNYLTLAPNETRIVTCHIPKTLADGNKLKVEYYGWNSLRKSVEF